MSMLPRLVVSSILLAAAVALAAAPPSPKHPPAVIWTKDVAPIVFRSCAECHHPGGPAPFSLLTYAGAQQRARQIAQVTGSRFMPPWLPAPDCGPFVGTRRLSSAQIALIGRWVAQGAPDGPAADLPPTPHFADGWRLGTPDQVVTMPRPYTLPGETTSPYRCFVLPLALPADKWLRAIEFRPGNPAVVRHMTLYVDPTGTARRLEQQSGAVGYTARDCGLGPGAERLAEWAVGSEPYTLPAGVAERLPAGADLVLLLRFETDGQPERVQSEVGLYDAPQPPTFPTSLTLGTRDLILRPSQKGSVTDTFTLPLTARLLRITPHGHPICRALQVTDTPPTGQARVLLRINDWNADWQDSYQFVRPPVLPAGSRLTVRWTVDNSSDNPRNPAIPPMTVLPGLLYLDDMATARLQMAPVHPEDGAALRSALQAPRPAPIILTTRATQHG